MQIILKYLLDVRNGRWIINRSVFKGCVRQE